MSVNSLEKAIARIKHENGGCFAGPVEKGAIESAQRRLGLTFPPSYFEFLLRLGVGDVEGTEFFGLCSPDGLPVGGEPDMLGVTLAERGRDGFPMDAIVVSEDGMGGFYVIDRSVSDSAGESPVRVWERGPGLTEYVAGSFGEYFLMEVQAAYEQGE